MFDGMSVRGLRHWDFWPPQGVVVSKEIVVTLHVTTRVAMAFDGAGVIGPSAT